MTTMSAPTPILPTTPVAGDWDADTVVLSRPVPAPASTATADRTGGLVLDATRLWTGGLATAAVAALVGLVGALVVRAVFQIAPVATTSAHAFDPAGTGLLCLIAAVAALAATGIAHLLLVSTPEPMAYLGWIIGLATAAATVLPLVSSLPIVAACAMAVVNLVIGLAIGGLVVNAAGAAFRPRVRIR